MGMKLAQHAIRNIIVLPPQDMGLVRARAFAPRLFSQVGNKKLPVPGKKIGHVQWMGNGSQREAFVVWGRELVAAVNELWEDKVRFRIFLIDFSFEHNLRIRKPTIVVCPFQFGKDENAPDIRTSANFTEPFYNTWQAFDRAAGIITLMNNATFGMWTRIGSAKESVWALTREAAGKTEKKRFVIVGAGIPGAVLELLNRSVLFWDWLPVIAVSPQNPENRTDEFIFPLFEKAIDTIKGTIERFSRQKWDGLL